MSLWPCSPNKRVSYKNAFLNMTLIGKTLKKLGDVFTAMLPLFCELLNKDSFLTVVKVLNEHNLETAFPNLAQVYRKLTSLPVGSTKCGRCFSKLIILKNRLRTSMGQSRLENLLL